MKIDDDVISSLKEKHQILVEDKVRREIGAKVMIDNAKAQYARDVEFTNFIFECAFQYS